MPPLATAELFVDRGERGVPAVVMDVVIGREDGSRRRSSRGRHVAEPAHLPGSFSECHFVPKFAQPHDQGLVLDRLPAGRSSISSRLARRVATGSLEPSRGQREQALGQPDDLASRPSRPVHRKKTNSSPVFSVGAPEKDCRRSFATPPGPRLRPSSWPVPLSARKPGPCSACRYGTGEQPRSEPVTVPPNDRRWISRSYRPGRAAPEWRSGAATCRRSALTQT